MQNQSRIIEILYQAIDETNLQLPQDAKLEKRIDEIVVGPKGKLDSLGLITFLVAAEEKLQAGLGANISLTSELTAMGNENPFRTIGSLAEFVASQLQ
jgi:acyl carrier protein